MKNQDTEGPMMSFLSTAFDFFMLFLLTVILCIPVITAGAAMTSCMYVGMKIHRKEAPAVFPSYFRAFKENFKQATLLWLIQIALTGFLIFDWGFALRSGWGNVNVVYRAFLIIASFLVLFFNMTLYAVIARFEMSMKSAVKTAFVLSVIHFPFLFLTVLMFGLTVFLCIRFFRVLPLFFAIGFTAATAFHSWIMKNACEKLRVRAEERGAEDDNSNENNEINETK